MMTKQALCPPFGGLPDSTIPLGSGRPELDLIGNKAGLLNRAAAAGLPVPKGYVLRHESWQHALDTHLIVAHDGPLTTPQASRLISTLALPPDLGLLAVRSAFSSEDGEHQSQAGFYKTSLRVNPQDATELALALCQVWGSGSPETQRLDVLLMEMVNAHVAGVAFTDPDYEDDLVNYTPGTAERLVSGETAGDTLELSQLSLSSRSATRPLDTPWAFRLQRLLRDVRRVFGSRPWDIEWADDGSACWLLQIRPITRRPRRNEAFTIANFKEILPELPSRFMSSLIASCADDLFSYYRRFDPKLPAGRPLIEVFYGRPLFNVSLLCDMLRRWGLPTRLVSNSIGGEVDHATGLDLTRLLRHAPTLLKLSASQFRAVPQSYRTGQSLVERAHQPHATFSDCIDTLQLLFTALVRDMLALTGAMSGPLLLLRQAGVLDEHHVGQKTAATEMFIELAELRQLVNRQPHLRHAIDKGQIPPEEPFRTAWAAFLDRHGHRGIYESDIARPRFRETPQAILASLRHPQIQASLEPRRTLLGYLTRPLWWLAARAIRARETLRSQAMKGFEPVRLSLLDLAGQAVTKGLLPRPESLWLLDTEEVRQLDQGWCPDDAFWNQRQREVEHLKTITLPDLLHRFDDLQATASSSTPSHGMGLWRGISLTTGEVTGRAWVLREPTTELPSGFTPDQTILVARSIDAGWIPTFGCVSGVVAETGGDLSHGSIILREIGLPAITNVQNITTQIKTGDPITLRAAVGVVENA